METSGYSRLYDAYYYAHGCGGRAYGRDEEWLRFFDSVAHNIVTGLQPDSVLDAGCAMGFLVEGLRSRGVEAFGVDISEYAIRNVYPEIRSYCWVGSILDPFPRRYDLIVSIEVLEHLPSQQAELAVRNFCRYSDRVLFSSTPLDYKEPTHLNVQPVEYWAELFAKEGFFRDVDFNADFLTPWAILFIKTQPSLHRLVRHYERSLWYLKQDNHARRELNMEQRQELALLEAKSRDLESRLATLQQTVQVLDIQARELQSIKGTMGWAVMKGLQSFRAWLTPPHSRREAWLLKAWEILQNIRQHGLRALFLRPQRQTQTSKPPMYKFQMRNIAGMSVESPLRLALYTTDTWTSACSVLRLIGPGQMPSSGIEVLKGIDWENGPVLSFPLEADAVVIQRDFPRHTDFYNQVEHWARTEGKAVVYELDDQLLELPSDHPEKAYFAEARDAMRRAIVSADAVVVSTLWLADYMRALNPNTWVLPNYLNDKLWGLSRVRKPRKTGRVVIGYMGGRTQTHLSDLALITPVLTRILDTYADRVVLRFWGVHPPELSALPNVEFMHDTFPDYGAFARYFSQQDVDIFVAPLRDNLFNRSKSWIKFLEYSALGVCGVYSRIAPYEGIVIHGKNGFLASGAAEWETLLKMLIEDEHLRRSSAEQALDTIQRMLLSNHAHEWGVIYRAALAAAPHRS